MAEQLCPTCGCSLGTEPYEKKGTLYCCEPCATGSQCECGCCGVMEPEQEEEPKVPKAKKS